MARVERDLKDPLVKTLATGRNTSHEIKLPKALSNPTWLFMQPLLPQVSLKNTDFVRLHLVKIIRNSGRCWRAKIERLWCSGGFSLTKA